MNKLIVRVLIGALALAVFSTASAGEVDETVDAAKDGHVDIINISGSIEVYGWSESRVEVTGELGEKVEELVLERNGDKVLVKVKVPRNNSNNISSDLTIRVPAGSSIDVSTVSADIMSEGVTGEQQLHTVSGDVEAEVSDSDVSAESVSGDVNVTGDGSDMELSANTVSGDVAVTDVSGAVSAEVVSGDVLVRDGSFDRATLNSVNGEVSFQAELRDGGKLTIETVNGDVDVQFGDDVEGRFDVETFNGDITNCFGPKPERTSKYTPGLELSYTVGDGGGRVIISTLNGDIDLCK